MACSGTYNKVRIQGLKHFLENKDFRRPATHCTITRDFGPITKAYDHHFLIERVHHYPASKALGTFTYDKIRVSGLKHFLEDERFRTPGTHYIIASTLLDSPVELFDHHFLLEKAKHFEQSKRVVVTIIHKGRDKSSSAPMAAIVKEDFLDFVYGDDYKVVTKTKDTCGYLDVLCSGEWKMVVPEKGYPTNEEEREDAVQRAKDRIGEKGFDFQKNCEFFVTEVLTGTGEKRQFYNGVLASGSVASSAITSSF